tara:strand:- start:1858 stop:2280 length:423 start_codon:yes stop_codon:yes gene_type:complete
MAKIEKHDGKLRIKNKYVPAFNFDDLTNDESKAVNWALQRIKQLRNSGVSYDMIEAELKVRFNINDVKTLKVQDTLFYQILKDMNLAIIEQGYTEKRDEKGEPYRVPHISIGFDVDELDVLVNKIFDYTQGVKNIKKGDE